MELQGNAVGQLRAKRSVGGFVLQLLLAPALRLLSSFQPQRSDRRVTPASTHDNSLDCVKNHRRCSHRTTTHCSALSYVSHALPRSPFFAHLPVAVTFWKQTENPLSGEQCSGDAENGQMKQASFDISGLRAGIPRPSCIRRSFGNPGSRIRICCGN